LNPVIAIAITENGAVFFDRLTMAGFMPPKDHFFNQYLQDILKARMEGVHVSSYCARSLIDNFEWVEAYL